MTELDFDSGIRNLTVGLVAAQGVAIGPADEQLRAACADVHRNVRELGMAGADARREAVRQLIRAGGFKPSGRNKPAQEYLLRTVTETGELPSILNVVDWINAVSLGSGLPISLLSARSVGPRALVRYGKPNETFVFNRSGQELGLEGLICICAATDAVSIPLGTPIKDSMAGKVTETDTDIYSFVYAPSSVVTYDEIMRWCDELARGFKQFCEASGVETRMITTN